MVDFKVLGQNHNRIDALDKVTGQATYASDVYLPDMLMCKLLPSTRSHARILRIDTSRAEQLPGVRAIITGKDFPDLFFGSGAVKDRRVMARDEVFYIGEPVAAVAADDETTAQEALELIHVEYQDQERVVDPLQAIKSGATEVHPDMAGFEGYGFAMGGNNCTLLDADRGDVDQAFDEADHVIEETYHSQAINQGFLEPMACVANLEANGRLTVWASTQGPYQVRAQLASVLDMPISRIKIIAMELGGGFGAKLRLAFEAFPSLLAMKTGRPVKLINTREEVFTLNGPRLATNIYLKTAVNSDGAITAREAHSIFDVGAYLGAGPNAGVGHALGPYNIPNFRLRSYGIYTNLVPTGALRGYGITQVAWAHESQMDIIADALGIDPLELRLKNVLQKGDPWTTGEPMAEMHYTELLKSAAERIGWNKGPLVVREGNKVRAKGLSAIIKGFATPTTSTATVKLNADGSLNVLTSTVEMGQGAKTVLAQIAADEGKISVHHVRVSEPDTALTPFDQMTSASRSTFCMGTAIRYAVQDVKEQLVELASERLEAAKDDLTFEDGRVMVQGTPERSLSYGDLIRWTKQNNLLGQGTFVAKSSQDGSEVFMDTETGQGYGSAEWHPAVIACEVEVDTETGIVKVKRLHAELYVGRVINPLLCDLQVEGSVLFGLGQSLFEELVFDTDGRITNPNLSDYMIPSFEDTPPELTVHLLEPEGVTEVHGIGETALPPIRPAIGNAVSRAIGVRLFDLPLTPERVLRALQGIKGRDKIR